MIGGTGLHGIEGALVSIGSPPIGMGVICATLPAWARKRAASRARAPEPFREETTRLYADRLSPPQKKARRLAPAGTAGTYPTGGFCNRTLTPEGRFVKP